MEKRGKLKGERSKVKAKINWPQTHTDAHGQRRWEVGKVGGCEDEKVGR